MRNRFFVFVVCLLLVAASISFVPQPVEAQGDSAIACDSTLITLLYIAEKDYGFKSSMDVAKFEKGQFKPLFEAMMSGMMSGTMEPMMSSTDEAMMEATMDAMMSATDEAMTDTGMMAELKPGAVQGENAACADLRAEVEGFLFKKLTSNMMMK